MEAVAADVDRQLLAQRVDDRDADTMEATGNLVALAVAKLAAGVEHRQDDLDRRAFLLLVHRHRDAAAIIDNRYRVVGVDRYIDHCAMAGERFVNRVIDDLVNEVVEAADTG